jgi:hypothetical protein
VGSGTRLAELAGGLAGHCRSGLSADDVYGEPLALAAEGLHPLCQPRPRQQRHTEVRRPVSADWPTIGVLRGVSTATVLPVAEAGQTTAAPVGISLRQRCR